MWRWLRKLGNVPSPIWVVEDSVSAVTTAGATVLPYALIFGTLYFGGLLIWWGAKRARYYWNDGPNGDRFRALAPSLRACRTKLIRHYENRGTSLVGFLPVVSEASAIMADFSGVFEQLIKLKIPVADAKRYMDETTGEYGCVWGICQHWNN